MSTNLLQPRPPRVPFVRPLAVRPTDSSGPPQWLLAGNLSLGGCFVRMAQPFQVGTRVQLSLEARGKQVTFAEAEVVWQRPIDLRRLDSLPGCGLRFTQLTDEARGLIRHLVDLGGTGRGQQRTVAVGVNAAPKMPTREPMHAPAPLIDEYLAHPPTPEAVNEALAATAPPAPPIPLVVPEPAAPVPAPEPLEALTVAPAPKRAAIEIDLSAEVEPLAPLEVELSERLPESRPSEPWFEPAEVPSQTKVARPRELSLDPASVGQVSELTYRPPVRRGSRLGTVVAGAALAGAVLGAGYFAVRGLNSEDQGLVALAERTHGLHNESSSPQAEPETASEPEADEEPAVELKAPPAPAERHAEAAPAPKAEPKGEAKAEPKPERKAAPSPAPKAVEAHASAPTPSAGDEIALPTGAARSVKVGGNNGKLEVEPELAPGSTIDRVFALSGPPRLVIDLNGSTPHGTPQVAGRAGVTGVRLGMRPGGTRLVLDLRQPAGKVHTQGNRITVESK